MPDEPDPDLDLDAIETRVHDTPPNPLTGIALVLVAEIRRLREALEQTNQT